MRLAVVQMQPVGERDADLRRMLALLGEACGRGAGIAVLPRVPSLLHDDEARDALQAGGEGCPEGFVAMPATGSDGSGRILPEETPLGRLVSLTGDDAIDPALLQDVLGVRPDVLVLRAEAESPLQDEAVLELAVGYSTSVAGLVVVSAATSLDAVGDPYGSSAIIQHGEVLAEAVDPEEILTADVDAPVRLQEPVSPLPEPQLILRQRLAHHRGGKAEVEWLADLD